METFSTKEQLYTRLLPALRVKKEDMKRDKMLFITEKEIWNFFCENIWPEKSNLTLGEMVDDILKTENFTIYQKSRKDNL